MSPAQPLRVIAPPPALVAAALGAGAALDRIAPLGPGFSAPLLGLPVATLGALLALWAVAEFRRARTTVLPFGTTRRLVPAGPYRYTRNPMYVGLLLGQTGLAVAIGSWWALALLPLVVLVLHHGVIRREEAHLEARFGDEYRSYRARVRRWM